MTDFRQGIVLAQKTDGGAAFSTGAFCTESGGQFRAISLYCKLFFL